MIGFYVAIISFFISVIFLLASVICMMSEDKASKKIGKYLYIIAFILFVAWAILGLRV